MLSFRGLFLLGVFVISDTHISRNACVTDCSRYITLLTNPAFASYDVSVHKMLSKERVLKATMDFICSTSKTHVSNLHYRNNHVIQCLRSNSMKCWLPRRRVGHSFIFSGSDLQHSTRIFMSKGDFGPDDSLPFDPRPSGRASKKWGRSSSVPCNPLQANTR